MITYIKANIIDEIKSQKYDAAAQCCNCFCTMGAGVARALAAEWPEILVADKKYHVTKSGSPVITVGDHNKLGNFSSVDLSKFQNGRYENVVRVYNLYAQYSYGRDKQHLDYSALNMALYKMYHDFRKFPTRLLMPKIGAGLGGGNWDKIEGIIERRLPDTDITICEL